MTYLARMLRGVCNVVIVLTLGFGAFCVWFENAPPVPWGATFLSELCSKWETFQEYLFWHGWRVTLYVYTAGVLFVLARIALSPRKTGKVVLWGAGVAVLIAGITTWCVFNVPCGARAMKYLQREHQEEYEEPRVFLDAIPLRETVMSATDPHESGPWVKVSVEDEVLHLPDDVTSVYMGAYGGRETLGVRLGFSMEHREMTWSLGEGYPSVDLRESIRTWRKRVRRVLERAWVEPEDAEQIVTRVSSQLTDLSEEQLLQEILAVDVERLDRSDDPAEVARLLLLQFAKENVFWSSQEAYTFETRNGVHLYAIHRHVDGYRWGDTFRICGFNQNEELIFASTWQACRCGAYPFQRDDDLNRIASIVEHCKLDGMNEGVAQREHVATVRSNDVERAVRLKVGGNRPVAIPRDGLDISAQPYRKGYSLVGIHVEALTSDRRVVMKSLEGREVNDVVIGLRSDVVGDAVVAELESRGMGDTTACLLMKGRARDELEKAATDEELLRLVLGMNHALDLSDDETDELVRSILISTVRKELWGQPDALEFAIADDETAYVVFTSDAGEPMWVYSFGDESLESSGRVEILDPAAPTAGSAEWRDYVKQLVEDLYRLPERDEE